MRRHPLMAATSVVLVLIVAAVIFVLAFDFKNVFAHRASASLGRPVTMDSARIKIFPLRIILSGVNVGPDAPEPMMQAGHIDATLEFWPLLAGRFIFRALQVEDASTLFERDAKGNTNWTPAAERDKTPEKTKTEPAKQPVLPEIKDLVLHHTRLHYREAASKTDLVLNLETPENPKGGERELSVKGKGIYQGVVSAISALGGSILTLRDAKNPYPIDLTFTSGICPCL